MVPKCLGTEVSGHAWGLADQVLGQAHHVQHINLRPAG